ncbi:hypothetical protein [Devosia sp. Root635]|uniref:hypothetical protein n=1 Tax=Devosia sp. Root635 TaxID=1736575 RepID=UPI000A84E81E|nr:hypothetical protein [Devosia sp. Root635]
MYRFAVTSAAIRTLASPPALGQAVEASAGNLTATVIAEGLDHSWAPGFLPEGR